MFGYFKYAENPGILFQASQAKKKREKKIKPENKPDYQPQAPDMPQQRTQVKTPPTPPVPKPRQINLDTAYENWKSTPSPQNMDIILRRSKPLITSAMVSYAGGYNPALNSKAKKIVIDAVKTYDPSKSASLKSWIALNLQGLRREAQSMSPITAPERVKIDNYRIHQAIEEYQSEFGMEPDDQELVKLTGLPMRRINYVRGMIKPEVTESQFETGDNEEGDSFLPGIPDDEWMNVWAEYVYSDLDPINKKIFDMRMGRGKYRGKPQAVADIARELGISAAAVSQRTNKIADRLAEGLNMQGEV